MMEMEVAVEKNRNQNINNSSIYSSSSADFTSHKLPNILKVAMIGESKCGKTALCEAYTKHNFTPASKYFMTKRVELYGKVIKSSFVGSKTQTDEKVNLVILDCSGKEIYKPYISSYCGDKIDELILVVDLSSSFGWLLNELASLDEKLLKKASVLIGAKSDLERKIMRETAEEFAQKYSLVYFETSAKNNSRVEEPFNFLAQKYFTSFAATRDKMSSNKSSFY